MRAEVVELFKDRWCRIKLWSNRHCFTAKVLDINEGDVIMLKSNRAKSAVASKEINSIEELPENKRGRYDG